MPKQQKLKLNSLSVIVACYNDYTAFCNTLVSLRSELSLDDELIVVDSSTDRSCTLCLVKEQNLICKFIYIWIPPDGVYPALNKGIEFATCRWIQIVNSGDLMMPNGRLLISQKINLFPLNDIHIFSQQAGFTDVAEYIFNPTEIGVWPHQSIITNYRVHERLGFYKSELRLGSDQIFFAKARLLFSFVLHKEVLTHFDLNGISSKISFNSLKESYLVWRALDRGFTYSLFKGFLLPTFRFFCQYLLGNNAMRHLRTIFYSHYKRYKL
jgi:glycosyltransferase involved in cell wall biosynthesis